MQGWLGSGQKGVVVLDNLNVTHIKEDDAQISLETSTIVSKHQSTHPGCLLDKDEGNCFSKFTRGT